MTFKSVVQGVVDAGNFTQQQGDDLIAQGGGNIKAQAQQFLAAGTITQLQHDALIATLGG